MDFSVSDVDDGRHEVLILKVDVSGEGIDSDRDIHFLKGV